VERDGDELVIRWSPEWAGGPVAIHAGSDPAAVPRGEPLLETAESHAALRDPAPGTRLYFAVVPANGGVARITAERKLPLDGAHNFRDLGGYQTADGRVVRWGRLFRSDALAGLSDEDLVYLKQIGLRLVCDFRSDSEVASDPDRLPPGALTLRLPIQDEALDPSELQRMIVEGDDRFDGAELLRVANESFARDWTGHWKQMLARFRDSAQLPALVHCTAGKDRAGYASALTLLALGVPEETVYQDYLRTNHYTTAHTARMTRIIWLISFFRTPPERSRPLFEARPEYLEAAFKAIRSGYGTVDAYLSEALELSAEDLAQLRNLLLSADGS